MELATDRRPAWRLQASRASKVRQRRTAPAQEAERYLLAGAEVARRLHHNYIGTEHILSLLINSPDGDATRALAQLGVTTEAVKTALGCWLVETAPAAKIDADALAALGIDFERVRASLEQAFGPGALERTHSACLGICPRLKLALAYALDRAADVPLGDQHVLLGLLSVPESVAARVLTGLGVSLEDVQATVGAQQ